MDHAIVVIDGEQQARELLVDLSGLDRLSEQRFVSSPRSLLVWSGMWDSDRSRYSMQAHRWDELGPEHTHLPDPIEPPPSLRHPVIHLQVDRVGVGQRFYTPLPAGGGCGSDRFRSEDRWYLLTGFTWPPHDEIPSSWPFQPEGALDGPLGYLFVEGHRVDPDTFRFFVTRGTTIEYRYDPDGAPEFVC